MAINPYTLYGLYQKGIIDYVPTDLAMPSPVGISTSVGNPYLDMAKQGGLYKAQGSVSDSFNSSYTPAYTPSYPQVAGMNPNYGASIGVNGASSQYNYNGYNSNDIYNSVTTIGSKSQAGGLNAFNGHGIGAYNNQNPLTAMGFDGNLGSKSQAGGINAFGGFGNIGNNLNNGIYKTTSIINSTPKFVLGILAGIIGVTGVILAFKTGKKPKTSGNKSFWSKLNPINWFKKNK